MEEFLLEIDELNKQNHECSQYIESNPIPDEPKVPEYADTTDIENKISNANADMVRFEQYEFECKKLELKQERAAHGIIRKKARAAALQEKEKQAIEFAKKKQQVRYEEKLRKLKAESRTDMFGRAKPQVQTQAKSVVRKVRVRKKRRRTMPRRRMPVRRVRRRRRPVVKQQVQAQPENTARILDFYGG